jgi:hypothetical protein
MTPASRIGLGHDLRVLRRVDHDRVAEPHGVEVERADLGLQRHDVLDPPFRPDKRRARARDPGIVVARDETAARPGREIDDQVGLACPDPLDHLPVKLERHRGRPGLRVAHVDVGDRGARLGGVDRGGRDLLGRDRQIRMLLGLGQAARDRACDNHLVRHAPLPSLASLSFAPCSPEPGP